VTKRNLPVTVSGLLHAVVACFFIVGSVFLSGVAFAEESAQTVFEVSPKRCVTLRQGQPCFVKVRIEWSSLEAVQVCVYGAANEKLKCWAAANSGSFVSPQTLPGTTEYVLVDSAGAELKRATVSVSWVYRKKRSKRRWRLF